MTTLSLAVLQSLLLLRRQYRVLMPNRLVKWWGEFQVSAPPDQKGMLNELDEEPSPRRRTRRPRKRAPRREGTA